MKGKLIKTQDGYILEDFKKNPIGQTFGKFKGKKLSLKNCQAIERGYDLDNYQYNEAIRYAAGYGHPSPEGFSDEQIGRLHGFIDGFQKALELIGDKKFSEGELVNILVIFLNDLKNMKYRGDEVSIINQLLQSHQKTEWDVEIETQRKIVGKQIIGSNPKIKGSGDIIKQYEILPKLDEDGCLILKRI